MWFKKKDKIEKSFSWWTRKGILTWVWEERQTDIKLELVTAVVKSKDNLNIYMGSRRAVIEFGRNTSDKNLGRIKVMHRRILRNMRNQNDKNSST